jgi:nitrate reductase gamma subunit
MSNFLQFSAHTLQEVALVVMATLYFFKLKWYLGFMLGKERQPATGLGDTNPKMGSRYSLMMVFKPGEMESTSTKTSMYAQFAVFHIGLFSSIALSFIIPYAPGILASKAVVLLLQGVFAAAFVVGLLRIYRRVSNDYIRAISSPDDYFSLILLTVWLAFAFMAAPNDLSKGEGIQIAYFLLTAFFLVYVPFSKISHYIFYPFHRTYIGRHFGRRGVYPIRRKPAYQVNK